jgi:hypothetical protein
MIDELAPGHQQDGDCVVVEAVILRESSTWDTSVHLSSLRLILGVI